MHNDFTFTDINDEYKKYLTISLVYKLPIY